MNGPTAKLLFSSRCSAPADEPQRLSRPDITDDGHRRALRSTRSRRRTAPSSPRAPPMPTPASCGSRACAPGAGRATAHVRLAFYCLMEPRAPAGCSAPSSTGAGRAAIPGAPSSAPGLLAAHGRSSSRPGLMRAGAAAASGPPPPAWLVRHLASFVTDCVRTIRRLRATRGCRVGPRSWLRWQGCGCSRRSTCCRSSYR
jgi:hypothetical protein